VPRDPTVPDADCQAAMRRVWVVYDAAVELQEALRERLASHPEFGPLLRSTPRDLAEEARTRALLGGALDRGEWEPYWVSIRETATGYANADVSFTSWLELIHLVRADLLERILGAHAAGSSGLRAEITALDRWLDDAMGVFGQAFISANEQVIARQQRAIRQLSTPVLQLRPALLLLPIVGALDRERLDQLRGALLEQIRARRARAVVLDVTGVPEIDSVVANQLIATVTSARMMGAEVVVSGLSADIAQTLVTVGIDLSQVDSAGDLQSGIDWAEAILSRRG
jgi:rsbT co-antagonist protein RsbR